MANTSPLATLSVAELLECYPRAASLFLRHRMACVGCDIAAFHTAAEAAAIYGMDAEQFLQELQLSAQAADSTLSEELE